ALELSADGLPDRVGYASRLHGNECRRGATIVDYNGARIDVIEDAVVILRQLIWRRSHIHLGRACPERRILGIRRDGHSEGDDDPGVRKRYFHWSWSSPATAPAASGSP